MCLYVAPANINPVAPTSMGIKVASIFSCVLDVTPVDLLIVFLDCMYPLFPLGERWKPSIWEMRRITLINSTIDERDIIPIALFFLSVREYELFLRNFSA